MLDVQVYRPKDNCLGRGLQDGSLTEVMPHWCEVFKIVFDLKLENVSTWHEGRYVYIQWHQASHWYVYIQWPVIAAALVDTSWRARITAQVEHNGSGASDSRLREPGFESCAVVLKPWASFFTLHCSSSLSCINEYLAVDSGGHVYEQPARINGSIWLDASQRSRDGVWVNRSVRELSVKRFERSWGLDSALYKKLPFYLFTSIHQYQLSVPLENV